MFIPPLYNVPVIYSYIPKSIEGDSYIHTYMTYMRTELQNDIDAKPMMPSQAMSMTRCLLGDTDMAVIWPLVNSQSYILAPADLYVAKYCNT